MSTTFASYNELYERAMQLIQTEAYEQAYDLLTREGPAFQEQSQFIYYLRICLAARLTRNDLALRLLGETLDAGMWYGELLLRESPSLHPLQGDPLFEQLVAGHTACRAAASPEPLLLVSEPPASDGRAPLPLLVALHGNGGRGQVAQERWGAVTAAGWLLAAPQSSQMMARDICVWNDRARALSELQGHHAALMGRYDVDRTRYIVGGFSKGAATAMWGVLSGTVPASSFLAIAPGGEEMDDPESWLPLLEGAEARGVRGYLLLGAEDRAIPQESIRALVELLNQRGVPCQLEVIEGLGHTYPGDLDQIFARAINFLFPT